jgi:hypothetical protein
MAKKIYDIDDLNGLKDRPRNGRPPEVPEKKLLKIRKKRAIRKPIRLEG